MPLLLALSSLVVAASVSARTESAPRSPRDCPRLFGSDVQRKQNAERRKRLLHRVTDRETAIDVTYSGKWSNPVSIHFDNVTLLRTTARGDGSGTAVFEVSASLAASSGCPAGRYELRADDKIGKKNVVLAVLRRSVLLERNGALVYVSRDREVREDYRMTWRAPFRLPHHYAVGVGHPVSPPRPASPVRR